MKLKTLALCGALFCAGLTAGCESGQSEGATAASVIRLTDFLDRARLAGPLDASEAVPEVEALRDAYAATDLAGDGAGLTRSAPWLPKRIPLLVDERRRFEDRVALFLPPPSSLTLPIRIPGVYRLRLHLGMMIEVGRSDPSRGPIDVDPTTTPEELESLRALGYVE